MNNPYLYLSYERSDARFAYDIVQSLPENYSVWHDFDSTYNPLTINFDRQHAIDNCAGVLLVLSQASSQSRDVSNEVNYAYQLGKPVIGVSIKNHTLNHQTPILKKHVHYIPQSTPSSLISAIDTIYWDAGYEHKPRPIQPSPEPSIAKLIGYLVLIAIMLLLVTSDDFWRWFGL